MPLSASFGTIWCGDSSRYGSAVPAAWIARRSASLTCSPAHDSVRTLRPRTRQAAARCATAVTASAMRATIRCRSSGPWYPPRPPTTPSSFQDEQLRRFSRGRPSIQLCGVQPLPPQQRAQVRLAQQPMHCEYHAPPRVTARASPADAHFHRHPIRTDRPRTHESRQDPRLQCCRVLLHCTASFAPFPNRHPTAITPAVMRKLS